VIRHIFMIHLHCPERERYCVWSFQMNYSIVFQYWQINGVIYGVYFRPIMQCFYGHGLLVLCNLPRAQSLRVSEASVSEVNDEPSGMECWMPPPPIKSDTNSSHSTPINYIHTQLSPTSGSDIWPTTIIKCARRERASIGSIGMEHVSFHIHSVKPLSRHIRRL
jgi:hypothetical protein